MTDASTVAPGGETPPARPDGTAAYTTPDPAELPFPTEPAELGLWLSQLALRLRRTG